jgi:hypothetical protein
MKGFINGEDWEILKDRDKMRPNMFITSSLDIPG